MAKQRSSAELVFHGAAGEVTGSCTALRTRRTELLVDCGMIQGGRGEDERNRQRPTVDFRDLDAVVLTHAHLDHCGRLPLLRKWGYKGPIYATMATRELARIILLDSAYLAQRDAERRTRKRRRRGDPPVKPLFTAEDAERVLDRFEILYYGERREIAPGVELTLHDAGHILGSAIAEMSVDPGDGDPRRYTVVFSGDLGKQGTALLRDPTRLTQADVVVMESTYGDRDHRSFEATIDELRQILAAARTEGGKVLIPTFAVGRSQELLYRLAELRRAGELPNDVVLDSPMAIAATRLYRRHRELYDEEARALLVDGDDPMGLADVQLSEGVADSIALNDRGEGLVILAGSGMMSGGRILHHLKHGLWRADVHVVVVGFQAYGTLGRRLVDGARHVRVMGDEIDVRAHLHTIGGLSAHAGRAELIDWAGAFADARPRFALNHGEPRSRDALAAALRERFDYRVTTPEPGEVFPVAPSPEQRAD